MFTSHFESLMEIWQYTSRAVYSLKMDEHMRKQIKKTGVEEVPF